MNSEELKVALLEAFTAKKAELLQRLSDFAVENVQKESGGKLNPVKIEGENNVQVVVPFSILDPTGENARKVEQQTHAFQDTYNVLQDKGRVEQILSREQS